MPKEEERGTHDTLEASALQPYICIHCIWIVAGRTDQIICDNHMYEQGSKMS